ncbi:SICAvar, type I (fragment), partial [Plasmodium knowlesi strain H]
SEFWTTNGDVGKLWKELSTAMKGKENVSGNGDCSKVDDNGTSGGRTPTDPEKRACQHLTAGFNQLKDSTSTNDKYTILKNNPLLRQTVGCFLLKEYAKLMQTNSKCVITSGLKKAFDLWKPKNNGQCEDDSPCIDCTWDESLDTCSITTSGSATQTKVTDKLNTVQPKIEGTAKEILPKINKMYKLCDYIMCAAPKWFYNQKNNKNQAANRGTAKTWCNFWDEGVQPELKKMFNDIEKNRKDSSSTYTIDTICRIFGDGNDDSVERKACNHIVAGLKYIKNIPPKDSGSTTASWSHEQDKQLLDRAVACVALNLYADQIITKSQEKCPIDEERIKKIFDVWNGTNFSCEGNNNNNCFKCERLPNFNGCELSVSKTLLKTSSPSQSQSGACDKEEADAVKVQTQVDELLKDKNTTIKMEEKLSDITEMTTFCSELQCAARKWNFTKNSKGTPPSWSEINTVVNDELKKLLQQITNVQNWNSAKQHCNDDIGSSWSTDTKGERTAKQKACKLFTLGLKHISQINDDKNKDAVPLKRTMMCAALNLYADQLITKSTDQCPLDDKKLKDAIKYAFDNNSNATRSGANSCKTDPNSCFVCNRQEKSTFASCQIGQDKIGENMTKLLVNEDQSNLNNNQEKTLEKINEIETFCTQVQCAIKQYGKNNNNKGQNGTVTWDDINNEAKGVLEQLLKQITEPSQEKDVVDFCKDNAAWNKGHKERKTNKAACLLFASGLQHIYGRGRKSVKGPFKGPSFEQTMGCLFLKEYAKQLQTMANEKKKGHSWVHPLCEIDKGINHAFKQSKDIMKSVLNECENGTNGISCFECTLNEDYKNCSIGSDTVENKVNEMFTESTNKDHMQQTLENTVCPILLTDLLTPFLPLAPVSIGLSAMAYYLWKYFGPLGKGGPRFRRSPTEIPGPSVQEQVLDHVEEAGPHEYRLVKERKPRSAPTRTKRSGRVNRRTIIEIHFEVLDECQKGDTQLNQKDFLELLVQEFMGSEFMEEEQVPKEEVLMEGVPMESIPLEQVPMERVPNLGSGFMV